MRAGFKIVVDLGDRDVLPPMVANTRSRIESLGSHYNTEQQLIRRKDQEVGGRIKPSPGNAIQSVVCGAIDFFDLRSWRFNEDHIM